RRGAYRRAWTAASVTTWMTGTWNFRSARCTRSSFSQRHSWREGADDERRVNDSYAPWNVARHNDRASDQPIPRDHHCKDAPRVRGCVRRARRQARAWPIDDDRVPRPRARILRARADRRGARLQPPAREGGVLAQERIPYGAERR